MVFANYYIRAPDLSRIVHDSLPVRHQLHSTTPRLRHRKHQSSQQILNLSQTEASHNPTSPIMKSFASNLTAAIMFLPYGSAVLADFDLYGGFINYADGTEAGSLYADM